MHFPPPDRRSPKSPSPTADLPMSTHKRQIHLGLFLQGEGHHPSTAARLEPLTTLAALAVSTSRIGLAATASTTYGEPFHTARAFASLDHLSKGRAAWNLVTTSYARTAANFGKEPHLTHA